MNTIDMTDILKSSRINNEALDIIGALCLHNDMFLQQLEGEAAVVDTLYKRIVRDPRYRDETVLDMTSIPSRRFDRWSMGMLAEDQKNRHIFENHSPTGKFSPFTIGIANVRTFFNEIQGPTRFTS